MIGEGEEDINECEEEEIVLYNSIKDNINMCIKYLGEDVDFGKDITNTKLYKSLEELCEIFENLMENQQDVIKTFENLNETLNKTTETLNMILSYEEFKKNPNKDDFTKIFEYYKKYPKELICNKSCILKHIIEISKTLKNEPEQGEDIK